MKTYLDSEEVMTLEEAASTIRDRLLIRLLWRSGCRISGTLPLEDITFEQGALTILHLRNCPLHPEIIKHRGLTKPKLYDISILWR